MLLDKIGFKTVFPNNIIGLIIIDSSGKILNINNKSVDLLGYEKNYFIGSQFSNFIIDADKNIFNSYFNSIDKANNSNTIEIRIKDFDDQSVHVDLELIDPIINDQKYYVGIIKDVFKRRKIEREVKELKEDKEHVLERLEEEKDLSDLKSRFVSMASHEFRTPLAGILSSLQLIQRYHVSEKKKWDEFRAKEKIETHFRKIEESVTNLTLILDDFLSLGKIEADKVVCKYHTFNLPQFLEDMCRDLKMLCKPNQKIEYQHIGDDLQVYLDAHLLRNITNNLISNAIKYSAENKTILLISKRDSSSVIIEVRDEGIGIPTSEHKNLFRRFFRAGNAINYQGTGLGLNIVKKYTELMDGTVTFESEENKGTTFFVSFPVNKNK